ncbi:MAG: Sulfurtransferase [uncultured Sulfurovum sp.]|uniref:Sulfurtransferase n=1 Tax=uncultured Sulfurovum sp. TaxID=269237 RepID=A0A6S6TUF3_9BACT|nr:MAG: Sulfurtransferase [uncultured Sulfurovum sp.]
MTAMLAYFAYFKGWILSDFENISPQEAYVLLQKPSNILLVDVRSQKEFDKDHIENALHFRMDKLQEIELGTKKILLYSERGERSVEASRILAKKGFKVLNLEGGVVFWIRAGYEVKHN